MRAVREGPTVATHNKKTTKTKTRKSNPTFLLSFLTPPLFCTLHPGQEWFYSLPPATMERGDRRILGERHPVRSEASKNAAINITKPLLVLISSCFSQDPFSIFIFRHRERTWSISDEESTGIIIVASLFTCCCLDRSRGPICIAQIMYQVVGQQPPTNSH